MLVDRNAWSAPLWLEHRDPVETGLYVWPASLMDVNLVTLNHRYTPLQLLGAGNFGCVVLAYDAVEEETVAVKVLLPSNYHSRYVQDELIHHNLLNEHPHIIKFREVFLSDDRHLCLAMEYADGGTLYSFVHARQRLDEGLARRFFQQLILGVTYCHRRNIAIRDIKLENLLMATAPGCDTVSDERWLVKLCDFGFSKQSNSASGYDMKSTVGTLAYMAPEVIQSNFQQQLYNGQVADIWSCGVVLFYMLYGRYPFNYDALQSEPQCCAALLMNMVQENMYPPPNIRVSDEAYTLLRALMRPHPRSRISLHRLYDNPWFTQGLPASVHEFNNNPQLVEQGPVQPEGVVRRTIERARLFHRHAQALQP